MLLTIEIRLPRDALAKADLLFTERIHRCTPNVRPAHLPSGDAQERHIVARSADSNDTQRDQSG